MINGVGKSVGPDLSAIGKISGGPVKSSAKLTTTLTSRQCGGGGRGRGRGGAQPIATVIAKTRDGHEYRGRPEGASTR